jgi:hypothetical protein
MVRFSYQTNKGCREKCFAKICSSRLGLSNKNEFMENKCLEQNLQLTVRIPPPSWRWKLREFPNAKKMGREGEVEGWGVGGRSGGWWSGEGRGEWQVDKSNSFDWILPHQKKGCRRVSNHHNWSLC